MSQNNENTNKKQNQQMEIELPDSEVTGTYSNLVMMAHSPSEFILDFISVLPGMPKAKVAKRMILTPDHAKRLAAALVENIKKYEANYGEIKLHEKVEVPLNFRGKMGEA